MKEMKANIRVLPVCYKEFDKYGNIKCKKCERFSSPTFRKCPNCCLHEELEIGESWHGSDDAGGWELDVVCIQCGKNYDWNRDILINNYKIIKK